MGVKLLGFDLRGHGMSERPTLAVDFNDGDESADDIAAVIGNLRLEHPILVEWSDADFVIGD